MNLFRYILHGLTHNHETGAVVEKIDKVDEKTSDIEKQVCELRTRTDKLYRFVSSMRDLDGIR
jgi:hypothetical protein